MNRLMRSLNFAVALSAMMTAGVALAQSPPAAPAAEPTAVTPAAPAAKPPTVDRQSPLFGQPQNAEAAKLAPVAGPVLPTPLKSLPLAKLHVPDGFKVEVYASGVGNARSMQLGDKGTLFVGSRSLDKVYAVTSENGVQTVKVIANGLHRPNGVAFHNGSLFVAELSKIWRYDDIEANLDHPPKPTLIYEDLPKDEAHGWKFIKIGPDNKLYVPIG